MGQPHSPAAEAAAAAALRGGPKGTTSVKPRRCLLGLWAEGEPGATYRFLYFCGVDTCLLADLHCCSPLSGSIL